MKDVSVFCTSHLIVQDEAGCKSRIISSTQDLGSTTSSLEGTDIHLVNCDFD